MRIYLALLRKYRYLAPRSSWVHGCVILCHLVEREMKTTERCYSSQWQQQRILPTTPSRFTPIDCNRDRHSDGRDGLVLVVSLPTTSPKLFLTMDNSSSSSSKLTTVWTMTAEGSVSGDVVTGATLRSCTSMVSMMSGAVSIWLVFWVTLLPTSGITPICIITVVGRIGCYNWQ